MERAEYDINRYMSAVSDYNSRKEQLLLRGNIIKKQ